MSELKTLCKIGKNGILLFWKKKKKKKIIGGNTEKIQDELLSRASINRQSAFFVNN